MHVDDLQSWDDDYYLCDPYSDQCVGTQHLDEWVADCEEEWLEEEYYEEDDNDDEEDDNTLAKRYAWQKEHERNLAHLRSFERRGQHPFESRPNSPPRKLALPGEKVWYQREKIEKGIPDFEELPSDDSVRMDWEEDHKDDKNVNLYKRRRLE